MTYYNDKTARLYNAGLELDESVLKGADPVKFQRLEDEFKGGVHTRAPNSRI